MNKKDLTNFVAEATNLTKKDSGIVIGAVLEGLAQGLIEDRKVTLVGFGSFTAVDRKARKARNPKTGEAIDVPAKVVPKFKASKALKDAIAELELGSEIEQPAEIEGE